MPSTERIAPTTSICRGPVYATSWTSLIWDSTTAITTTSSAKPTRHERNVVTKPPSSGPTAAAIASGGPDQRVGLRPRRPLEVPVDQGLHRGQQQRRPEAADDRPEDDDRGQALRERHRQRADRIGQQTQHVGPLAPDQIADLAADQDERGRHQRLERDRRLDAAHGRVEIVDHGRDRDVHQRRVDDEHEHRHRQQEGELRVPDVRLSEGR